jgi:hypothetical protein
VSTLRGAVCAWVRAAGKGVSSGTVTLMLLAMSSHGADETVVDNGAPARVAMRVERPA